MTGKYYQRFIVFGGHRLWQGFAPENSAANQWSNDTTYPSGGYLSDFWVYTRVLDFTSPVGVGFRLTAGKAGLGHCLSSSSLTCMSALYG